VGVQGEGDLCGREGDSPGGVDYQVDWGVVGGEPYRPEDLLAVVDVDVPGEGYPEEGEGLLPVDEGDHVGAPLHAQVYKLPPAGPVQGPLLHPGDEEREYDEDDPDVAQKGVEAIHRGSIG
jgi:hypothetical protein